LRPSFFEEPVVLKRANGLVGELSEGDELKTAFEEGPRIEHDGRYFTTSFGRRQPL
jgi:hypothetical protein